MGEDLHNCCRICLDSNSEHISILENPTITLHMKSCLTITISPNDNLPKAICKTCASQLGEFYNFQLNARCSQDWLESSLQEKNKKCTEMKIIHPLPDSEYNSDSLLEFLNNTTNIEEYLNNLGKEDIPSIVNMLDRNENTIDIDKQKSMKQPSPKKKETNIKAKRLKMEIDVLDSDVAIVKGILMKETEMSVSKVRNIDENACFACKTKFDTLQKLSQHIIVCDSAQRTCIHCNILFDSRHQMQIHSVTHNASLYTCNCGKTFETTDKLINHHKTCHIDYANIMGCIYRCKECGDTFKDRFQLYKHVKHHVLKAEERICDICGHQFKGSAALAKHRKEEHEKPDNIMYRCKVCDLTSSDRKEIYLHVKKHTLKQPLTRHLCESCGKCFTTRSTLLRHSLLHEDSKEVPCKYCNKKDISLRDTSLHTEMVICEKCGQTVNNCKLGDHYCG